MNIYLWLVFILGCIYGGLTLFACLLQYKQKLVNMTINSLMLIGAVIVIFSSVLLVKYNTLVYLIIGLLCIHFFAVINGYTLYKKIHVKHHLIRISISVIIVALYMIGM